MDSEEILIASRMKSGFVRDPILLSIYVLIHPSHAALTNLFRNDDPVVGSRVVLPACRCSVADHSRVILCLQGQFDSWVTSKPRLLQKAVSRALNRGLSPILLPYARSFSISLIPPLDLSRPLALLADMPTSARSGSLSVPKFEPQQVP